MSEFLAFELLLNASVAFAGGGFQSASIQDLNPTVRVPNQAHPLQLRGNTVDRRSPRTEHDGDELLCEHKVVAVHTVVHHEQPAAAPLRHGMKRVTCDALHQAGQKRLRVPLHDVFERIVTRQFLPEAIDWKPDRSAAMARRLHEAFAEGTVPAEERSDAHHSFLADGRHFHPRAVAHDGREGADAVVWKVDIPHRPFPLMKHLRHGKWNGLHVGKKPLIVLVWERIQKSIGDSTVLGGGSPEPVHR
jgi:hypothetical protein